VITNPIALRAKEGLRALMSRNKSAPLTPKGQVRKPPPSQSSVSPKMGSRNNNESAMLLVEIIDEKIDRPPMICPIL
jgi:hypothetical protein